MRGACVCATFWELTSLSLSTITGRSRRRRKSRVLTTHLVAHISTILGKTPASGTADGRRDFDFRIPEIKFCPSGFHRQTLTKGRLLSSPEQKHDAWSELGQTKPKVAQIDVERPKLRVPAALGGPRGPSKRGLVPDCRSFRHRMGCQHGSALDDAFDDVRLVDLNSSAPKAPLQTGPLLTTTLDATS